MVSIRNPDEGARMTQVAAELADSLATVQWPGDFAVSGRVALALPALEVEGFGLIGFPLTPLEADRLVACAEPAPFGRGGQTLIDESVRRCRQVDAGRVLIGGTHWQDMLDTVLRHVAAVLADDEPITAEFYKLLIYRQGDFFVSHRDSEKQAGMFATLVLAMPSQCEGGTLVVRHQTQEFRPEFRVEDPSEIAYAAFYADCSHEVLPVTAGCRLVLIYNLMRPGRTLPLAVAGSNRQADAVATLLHLWSRAEPGPRVPRKLVYPLSHVYTRAELSFAMLKGTDAGVADVVMAAAAATDCALFLAQFSVEESGRGQYGASGHVARRWADEDSLAVDAIDQRIAMLSQWRDSEDHRFELADLPVAIECELAPPHGLEVMVPDVLQFKEATGNQGATFERSYRRAALVIWAKDNFERVLSQGGHAVVLPYLDRLLSVFAAADPDGRASVAAQAGRLARQIIADWPPRGRIPRQSPDPRSPVEIFLGCLARLGDGCLIESASTSVLTTAYLVETDVPAIVAAWRCLPETSVADLFWRIVVALATNRFAPLCALLNAVSIEWPAAALMPARILVRAMPGCAGEVPGVRFWDQWRDRRRIFVGDLLSALLRIDAKLALETAETMLDQPEIYRTEEDLVPAALRLHADAALRGSPVTLCLRKRCIPCLEAETAQEPQPPSDWKRADSLGCRCEYCQNLARFLQDPIHESWTLTTHDYGIEHLADKIKRAAVDVDWTTEDTGEIKSYNRQIKLVCTKNQASYNRAAERHRTLSANLAELRARSRAAGWGSM